VEKPNALSSFQATILIIALGLLFVLIMGLTGIGINRPTDATLSPTSVAVATTTVTVTPTK
jgi:hypothetical protein